MLRIYGLQVKPRLGSSLSSSPSTYSTWDPTALPGSRVQPSILALNVSKDSPSYKNILVENNSGNCFGSYRKSDRPADCVELKHRGIEHAVRVGACGLIGSGGLVGEISAYTIPLIDPNPTSSDCRGGR